MTRRRREGGDAAATSGDAEAVTPSGPLRIVYVRVSDAVMWDGNPKRHDMGGIVESIRQHGFRDAPIYDHTLGAIVAGNGRTTALQLLQEEGPAPERDLTGWPPVGVVDREGEWWMPMQVGIDAPSVERAESFGVTHNVLTATGGDLGLPELAGLFHADRLEPIMQRARVAGVEVVSFDPEDVLALLHPPPPAQRDHGGDAAAGAKTVTCPHCGHTFPK